MKFTWDGTVRAGRSHELIPGHPHLDQSNRSLDKSRDFSDQSPVKLRAHDWQEAHRRIEMTLVTHLDADAPAAADLMSPSDAGRQVVEPEIADEAPGDDRPRRTTDTSGMEETVLKPASSFRRLRRGRDAGCDQRLVNRRIGQYRIASVLGRGSMACVYRARHLGLHRPCALKVLDSDLVSQQPGLRKQFWAEARAAANLIHPHVVTIHNLGSAQGFHFIEMEYVPGGQTLREALVRQGPLDPARAAHLARQIVLALGAAHDSGLVHRDIKPANVLLTPEGKAKLADFGLVRRVEDLALGCAPLAGTPSFMAPELFQGTPASPRSDIYALGVLLYYTLSGRLPFAADTVGELVQLHRAQPVPDIRQVVPSVPDALFDVLERCLAKLPEDRFECAGGMAAALERSIHRQRDTESLVRESTNGVDCFIQGCRDTFRVIMPLPGDRLQEVVIEVTEEDDHERYLSVFSVCGPAEPKHFAYALKLNAHLTYGSISIHKVLGSPMFVMSRTFLLDTARPDDIRDALIEIARRSDHVEKQLTQMDQY
jgi:serine/threonine-protein kinase